jgi:uncharacterized damage-inducible protein DinB
MIYSRLTFKKRTLLSYKSIFFTNLALTNKKNTAMSSQLINDYCQQLTDIINADLWLDENFEKKLSQVQNDQVFKRPIPEIHSVAELISHLYEWRMDLIGRLKGYPRSLNEDDPRNWKTNDILKNEGWEKLYDNFHKSQKEVVAFLKTKDDTFLDERYPHSDYTYRYLVQGLIHHDCYHLGQLGLTIKLL